MSADDRAAFPVFLAAGMEPKDVEKQSKRDSLDLWLESPSADVVSAEKALVRFLQS